MSVIAEYQFLRRDERFENVLSKYEKNELNAYFEFDEYVKNEIEEMVENIKQSRLANVYERLADLEIKLNEESIFLGRLRMHARCANLQKEMFLATDAMKKIISVVKLVRAAGSALGEKRRLQEAISALEEAKKFF
jgi:hypothetical protein